MDSKKICFIMCTNNDLYEEESMFYLRNLNVPIGYQCEILCIKEACSMCAGYNEGMYASDAKYKVYLHQDVFIINRDFIYDILKVFNNKDIGMIGMVGSPKLPKHGVMWNDKRIGKIYGYKYTKLIRYTEGMDFINDYIEVEAIDGLLIATQVDIKWREDIFKHWDYYDVSQSFEFRKQGWKVVVPRMENEWCIHDDGYISFENYYENRRIFLNEYII